MDINLKRGVPGMGMPSVPPQLPMLLLVLGIAFVGLGLLLLANEWLLRWLVAGVFILIGGVLLLTGWRAKKMLG